MNSIKIIFFDIDGTLIDMRAKRISEKMLETLIRLKENGIILCIATGRSPISLPYFEGVEFDAFLTFNGSYCFDKNHTIFSNPIPAEDVQTIIQNAAAIGRPVSLATKEKLAANGKDKDLMPELQRRRLMLYYYGGYTFEQIGNMEGCTKRAVKKSVDSALDTLKKYFANFRF